VRHVFNTDNAHDASAITEHWEVSSMLHRIWIGLIVGALSAGVHSEEQESAYRRTDLVSNVAGAAATRDANAINVWGIAFGTGPVWVTDNGSSTSTLYDGNGKVVPLVVKTQPDPTGIVWYNGTSDFKVDGTNPATFIFSTEGGVISGWSRAQADRTVDIAQQTVPDAVFKGLAIAGNGTKNVLYATDFFHGQVATFGPDFKPIALKCGFSDPELPDGFAPFGIQNVNGDIYVTYAKQDAARHDNLSGPGLGRVDVFDANGCLVRGIEHFHSLNAPWGVAIAPASFGRFGGAVLIGNFGDGWIGAYDSADGHFLGFLEDEHGERITIPGLWGIAFGNGAQNQPANTLFFAAGPNGEKDGLYGRIDAVATEPDQK
jgi:uncharacterized protein (TIGR03118 family)